MVEAAKKALASLLLLMLVQASFMAGATLSGVSSAGGKGRCRITLDVCGRAAPGASQSLETVPFPHVDMDFYFPSISVFPPIRALAVASAEPGEIDKPPKA